MKIKISPSAADAIKSRLSQAREKIERVKTLKLRAPVFPIAQASYELARGLKLPAVRSEPGLLPSIYLDDLFMNLSTIIDYDLTQVEIDHDPGEVVFAASDLLIACQALKESS